ncbi:HNH endonuclease [Halomonas sp. McH1-25]|uniref:HNH endonuclease n=1 Tax=unclassified Halomonas TaxID=2609666 RepID=UPI001EF72728|nr:MULTISPECIES: HNH endonuclease [unclassified Halomonas]MCG7598861.1 HNH endonuclease [Halomonas sp. McH1-25]MCP1340824.1 HNH endonuclease [Halomonas sp. FL8]MCP1361293.1 HNH endonuclease [Halomonas sp. BBD45]MCP1364324.1 HNH endonuclease [Halomonas sp. BBD48]
MKANHEQTLDGVKVAFAKGEWFNASQLASRFGKDASAWLKMSCIKDRITLLTKAEGASRCPFVKRVRSNDNPGIWLHYDLLALFCNWLPCDVSEWVREGVEVSADIDESAEKLKKLDREYLWECFSYDADEGVLRWNAERPAKHFRHAVRYVKWLEENGGKAAGSAYQAGSTSYVRLSIDGVKLPGHTVVLAMHGITVPKGMMVDHLNGDGIDNRLENLRVVTPQLNSRNRRMNPNNTSGANGVYWCEKRRRWIAQGPKIYLGAYKEKSEAIRARKNWEKREGNFTKRHGLPS